MSGKNLIRMAELKEVLVQYGFEEVNTYIQSGNIALASVEDAETVSLTIRQLIGEHFNLAIDVFVFPEDKLKEAFNQNPFDSALPGNRVFATFMNIQPGEEARKAFEQMNLGDEQFKIIGDVFYFYLPQGMANSKLSNNFIEKKLKVKSTGRNINTVQKMIALLKGLTPLND